MYDPDGPIPQTPRFLGPPVDCRGVIVKTKLRTGRAESLAALSQEYAFFTPAALYLHGRFTDAPLIDYMHERGCNVPLYHYKFNRPLFAGLETTHGNSDWNHVLWAVGLEHWPSLLDFICGITMVDRARQVVHRYGQQFLGIVDPLVMDQQTIISNVPKFALISFLGIYGNQFKAVLQHPIGAFSLPRLARLRPDPADIAAAKAHFDDRNPLDAREAYMLKNSIRADFPSGINGN